VGLGHGESDGDGEGDGEAGGEADGDGVGDGECPPGVGEAPPVGLGEGLALTWAVSATAFEAEDEAGVAPGGGEAGVAGGTLAHGVGSGTATYSVTVLACRAVEPDTGSCPMTVPGVCGEAR
jgi:hypothetical protein